MKQSHVFIISVLIPVLLIIMLLSNGFTSVFSPPQQLRTTVKSTPKPSTSNTNDVEVIARNLEIPWDISFLPNKDMLVTQRNGKLLKIGAVTKTITEITDVRHIGEGGLLGIALHSKFKDNTYVYLYSTTQDARGITNRVERYTYLNDTLLNRKIIIEGIRGSANHDGGRIVFGPDGYLYITTGDAEQPNLAQNTSSLNGKILRVKDDGTIPADNPFGNAVFSYGHRNPQGLAWDANGTLWETEHGPSSEQTGNDEVNKITKGSNYGWPVIKGRQTANTMVSPVAESGTTDTWAPAGLLYFNGKLYFTGLKGEALYEATITNNASLTLVPHFKLQYGRLRTVVIGPDGFMYVTTSNTDGRGKPKPGDDMIIRINPAYFTK